MRWTPASISARVVACLLSTEPMPPIEPRGLPRGRLLGTLLGLFSTVFDEFKRDLVLMPLELCGGGFVTLTSALFLRDAFDFFCVFSTFFFIGVSGLSFFGTSSCPLSHLEPPALGSVRLFVCPLLVSFRGVCGLKRYISEFTVFVTRFDCCSL